MGSMAEDQPLGLFPRSSRSPSCWCPVSCGKPHIDFAWLSLHCEATPAPSYPGLDLCHLGFSPVSFSSGRATTSSGAHLACHISAPAFRSLCTTTSVPRDTTTCAPPPSPPQPLHSSLVPRLSGPYLARPSAHFLTRGSSNRGSHGTPSCLSTSFTPGAPFSLTPCFHPQSCSAGHLPAPSHPAIPPPPPFPDRLCSRRGCTSPVPPLCSTGYCDCHSHRCPHHRPSVPHPLLLLPFVLLAHPARVLQVALLFLNPTVLWASAPLTAAMLSSSCAVPLPRRPDCLEPAPPDCPVRFFWQSSFDHFWPIHFLASPIFGHRVLGPADFGQIRSWPIHFWTWCKSWLQRVGPKPRKNRAPKSGTAKGGAPKGGARNGGRPKMSRFFLPLPPPFSLFFCPSGCLLVEFWWCLPQRPHPESPTCTFEGPDLPPKFNEKTPRERQKEQKMGREREEKEPNVGRSGRGRSVGGAISANFDFGQFRLRPISTSANFRMLNFWTTKGGAPKGGGRNLEKVGSHSLGPRRVEPRKVGPRRVGGRPEISRFFSLSHHSFHSFLPLLLVLSWNFGGV